MPAPDYASVERLLLKITWKVLRRVHAAGCRTMTQQDLMQEAAIAFCIARDRWDESLNVPFSSYLVRGVLHRLNRYVQKEISQRHLASFDLDAHYDDTDMSFEEVIPDRSARTGEDVAIETSARRYVLSRVSPVVAKFLELLDSPPDWLLDEVNALRARYEYARERGISSTRPRGVTAAFIVDILGLSATERRHLYKEIEMMTQTVQKRAI